MARRLELLGAELAGFRGGDDSTHTRVRPGREQEPPPGPPVVPVPGRHAARGRLTLGAAQLAVVGLLVLAALGGAAWWLLGGGRARGRRPGGAASGR